MTTIDGEEKEAIDIGAGGCGRAHTDSMEFTNTEVAMDRERERERPRSNGHAKPREREGERERETERVDEYFSDGESAIAVNRGAYDTRMRVGACSRGIDRGRRREGGGVRIMSSG